MTQLLLKIFIKNMNNMEDKKVRTDCSLMASVVGIILNLLLFGVKITAGLVTGSISVLSDAFNSLSDSASSIIGFFGTKISSKPADENRPFGYGRVEYLTSMVIALVIFTIGCSLGYSSVKKIFAPEELQFYWWAAVLLLLCLGVKLWLFVFNRSLAKLINSSILKASAQDARGDAVVTATALMSVLVERFTGFQIDGYVGVAVACYVVYSAVLLLKETVAPVIGEAAENEIYEKVNGLATSFEPVLGTHDFVLHNYGSLYHMGTIHLEIPSEMSFESAHEVADKIEQEALKRFNLHLVTHMDPLFVNDEAVREKRDMIERIVLSLEPCVSLADFRIVAGKYRIYYVFDLAVPHGYDEDQRLNLKLDIMDRVEHEDENVLPVIRMTTSFVSKEH
ncbi:cation diffusion facilitator family transporter [Candidatus Formimonas warabiya]|uniref:Uncharacterized protein n=1 Tax=Formimonas warabiya TaxID=1761012 RepID=A0A3G1KRV6_FORW1|nr:cation diffusion facilitator family transporter [Candidatus Formimonas warabiya]ATW25207.1 hypothetical protein DCMF_10905 [Candidatus Formimonas warabiya]